jgi:NADP-dependent 3-hydroxy acid dehydrogenase YdfG
MSLDAVVTGASTGIGCSAVKVLVGHGWRVFAGVRKVADAESLRKEFGEAVVPLLFDVADIDAVRRAAEETRVKLEGRTLKGLVNNAGLASADRSRISRSTRSDGCSTSTCSARQE